MSSLPAKHEGLERRRSQRRLTYVGEGFDVVFHLGEIRLEGHIIDLSAEGLGVIIPAELIPASFTQFASSLIIKVEMRCAQLSRTMQNARIVSIAPFQRLGESYLRFGIQFMIQRSTHFSRDERKARRFGTSRMRPQAYFTHPLFFKETIHLDVIEASANGLTCLTSIANTTLIRNLLVRLSVYLPTKGLIEIDVRLVNAKVNGDEIRVGFEVLAPIESFRQAASEIILLNNPDISLSDLRSEGFKTESLKTSIKFRFAEPGELRQVWEFRYQMLQEEDWISPPTSITEVQEDHDKYSRHLLALVHGKLVSVSRLVFNNGVRERSEHAHYDVEIPDWLWREGFVEFSRILTHRDFRGSQIFLQMLQFIGLAGVGSGYRYAVFSSSASLEPIYRRVGCKFISRFTIPGENTQWSLYYMDMQKCVKGRHVGPLAWWFFHRPLLKLGTLKGWVKLSFLDKIRLFTYSLVGRTAAKLMKKTKRQKK